MFPFRPQKKPINNDNSVKFEDDSTTVLAADTLCGLVTLTSNFLTLVRTQGLYNDQPIHQIWRSHAYPTFWVGSDISHTIPLTVCSKRLRMRRITWRMPRSKFFQHIWNPCHCRPTAFWGIATFIFALYKYTYLLTYLLMMTLKGRL